MNRPQALLHITSLVLARDPKDATTWEAIHSLLEQDFPAAAREAAKAAALISVSEKHQLKFTALLEECKL